MSTAPLTKLWIVEFTDGHVIKQTVDDRYSKHDDSADYNPSAFRDVLEYPSPIESFSLGEWTVYIQQGIFRYSGENFSLEEKPLKNRKLIYFREMRKEWHDGVEQEAYVNRYAIGYEGMPLRGGRKQKKIIFIEAG